MKAKNKLPNVLLTDEKQGVVDYIISQSTLSAEELKKPYVTREMSLLATLNAFPSLINKLKKLDLDGDAIYRTLYFKHSIITKFKEENPDSEVIDNNGSAFYDSTAYAGVEDEGEGWKKLQVQNKAPAPDLGYQISLHTQLVKSQPVSKALWCVFLNSIKEMVRNNEEKDQDPRLVSSVLDYFCTSYPEGLSYATLRPEVEDEMYDLRLLEFISTKTVSHTEDPVGVPVNTETIPANNPK